MLCKILCPNIYTSIIYNIGNNCEKTNLDVVKFILKVLGKSENLIVFVKDRPGNDLRYAIDSSKLKNELNWECKYNFEDGMIETINWYVANQSWINNIKTGKYINLYKQN